MNKPSFHRRVYLISGLGRRIRLELLIDGISHGIIAKLGDEVDGICF